MVRPARTPADDLPFEDDTFDTVVSTVVLCTVDDQPRALRELRRVLRGNGELLPAGGRLRGHPDRARHPEEGPTVRPPAHRRG
ncbi:MAG TPA: class I SAM-dependent methyltransferase, partial [Streptosporangiaceae bacterium]